MFVYFVSDGGVYIGLKCFGRYCRIVGWMRVGLGETWGLKCWTVDFLGVAWVIGCLMVWLEESVLGLAVCQDALVRVIALGLSR